MFSSAARCVVMHSCLLLMSCCLQVLARSEDGSQYPCCTFVAPLQLGRQLSTPRHAARFVSLLHRREEVEAAGSAATGVSTFLASGGAALGVVDGATGCWCSLHTVLASKSASHVSAVVEGERKNTALPEGLMERALLVGPALQDDWPGMGS